MMSRILVALFALTLAGGASAEVRVVASLPVLGSIAREVAGPTGNVTVLAPAEQDPHFVDGKPSMILALNRADLLLHVGVGLEAGWLPTLITGSRNGAIQPGQAGNLDVSTLAGPLLEVGTPLDRALGDIHPGGNPHYWYDARRVRSIASGIAERLAQLDQANAATYRANAARFDGELQKKIGEWETLMRPYRGRALVSYHKSLVYLSDWLGLEKFATIEPLPGIAPSPSHLADLILRIRGTKPAPIVASEPWYNLRTAQTVAEKGGAPFVRLPGDVGSVQGKTTYIAHMDELISRLKAAMEEK